MKGKNFCLLIARHPVKWMNSCMRFNADMWKWWGVNGSEPNGLSFIYKGKHISVKKMVNKWNTFYNDWMDNSSCDIVWFADLLNEDTRDRILLNIAEKNNLVLKTDTITIPKKVQHSDKYNDTKKERELNLEDNDMLKHVPRIGDYVINNMDKGLIERIQREKIC